MRLLAEVTWPEAFMAVGTVAIVGAVVIVGLLRR